MRVLLGMVGVLLLLVVVVGLVLGAVCGVQVDDVVALELGCEALTVDVEAVSPLVDRTACVDAECPNRDIFHVAEANEWNDQSAAEQTACKYQRNGNLHEASGAAGVQHGTKAGHDDLAATAIRSGRFTGAPA